uniref:Uncharacterized protein n=1 Tax=Anguilla anguilla TaxID=7936 RepID=A0A0E9W2G4_ANGAN
MVTIWSYQMNFFMFGSKFCEEILGHYLNLQFVLIMH